MKWDLIIERNLQKFIRLADLKNCILSDAMYWRYNGRETYLNYRNNRLHLSQYITHVTSAINLLRQGLQKWTPYQFDGIPQRLYVLGDGIAISCALPVNSKAELWFKLHKSQQFFLEKLCLRA